MGNGAEIPVSADRCLEWKRSAPVGDYAEEAAFYRSLFQAHCRRRPCTLLDLGSGGGHNAAHLKATMECTLVDLEPSMLSPTLQKVRAVEPCDARGQQGRLHIVEVEYLDDCRYPEAEQVLWEVEATAKILGATSLPSVDANNPERL